MPPPARKWCIAWPVIMQKWHRSVTSIYQLARTKHMNSETRQCQNCKSEFTIDPEDFKFYEKIKVPPPTWCPECRAQRRFTWRNEHFLFLRKEDYGGKDVFSMHPKSFPGIVWEMERWWSDDWDQNAYGRDYDWNKPFFEQFRELFQNSPLPSRAGINFVNSDYANHATNIKDCYMVFGSTYLENCAYTENSTRSKDCVDNSQVIDNELCYEGFFNQQCYRAIHSSLCENCQEIIFCKDCVGCSNCVGCIGLRNKSYCIFNQQYSKAEYGKRVDGLNLNTRAGLQNLKEKALSFWLSFPNRYVRGRHNVDTSGEYISNSKNVKESYYVDTGENLKFCQYLYSKPAKDSYDHYRYGLNSELCYEAASCGDTISDIKFCYQVQSNCVDVSYSYNCINSSHLFGCVAIHGKQYCILNKQYSKEEYEKMIPRIIEHMNSSPYTDKAGRVYKYGEFFPGEISPCAYNQSLAQEFFPLTEDTARKSGYEWQPVERNNYAISLRPEDIPNSISEVSDSILSAVIGCANSELNISYCPGAFRVTPQELMFYRRLKLLLPKFCPNCRYFRRLEQRAPLRLCHRRCQCSGMGSDNGVYQNAVSHGHGQSHCPNEFETSYAPERPEIVYCEHCYNSEIV